MQLVLCKPAKQEVLGLVFAKSAANALDGALVIARLKEGSIASSAGLEVRDRILTIRGRSYTDAHEAALVLREAEGTLEIAIAPRFSTNPAHSGRHDSGRRDMDHFAEAQITLQGNVDPRRYERRFVLTPSQHPVELLQLHEKESREIADKLAYSLGLSKEKLLEDVHERISSVRGATMHHVSICYWLPHATRISLKADILAGLTVGVMAIPQSISKSLVPLRSSACLSNLQGENRLPARQIWYLYL
ncbi:hypothetical protein T492DRAFT_1147145 [Pavlovales sp. CCMP2436]|nr:hypothetical protein T492DRAFT_1147145 [Pavlovales sp. CCMP2436]